MRTLFLLHKFHHKISNTLLIELRGPHCLAVLLQSLMRCLHPKHAIPRRIVLDHGNRTEDLKQTISIRHFRDHNPHGDLTGRLHLALAFFEDPGRSTVVEAGVLVLRNNFKE